LVCELLFKPECLCLGNQTNAKLQLQGLRFVDWICRLADEQLKMMGPILLNGLKKMLNHQELDANRMLFLIWQCAVRLTIRCDYFEEYDV
jgi:hypothetical protein